MTAIIDRGRQTTMSGDEVRLRSTFVVASTSLAAGDVYFALPGWAPLTHRPQHRAGLRGSLFDSFAGLAELLPNWDGYGANPPTVDALNLAARFLAALPDEVPDPRLLPATNGNVLVEWDTNGVELLLSLGEGEYGSAVVAIDGGDDLEGPVDVIHDQILHALVTLADRG